MNLSSSFENNNLMVFEPELPSDFNNRLERIVYSLYRQSPDWFKNEGTAVNGISTNFCSRTEHNLFRLNSDEIQVLRKIVIQAKQIYIHDFKSQYRSKNPNFGTCWVNVVNSHEGDIHPHRHHNNPFNLTGIYYAAGHFPDGKGGTRIWIENGKDFIIRDIPIKAGTFVLFQGTLLHSVPAYSHPSPRIVFAVDIRFKPQDQAECPYIDLHQ